MANHQTQNGKRRITVKNNISLKDDFYSFANKEWLNQTKIPKRHQSYDNFISLGEKVERQLKKIIQTTPPPKFAKNVQMIQIATHWNDTEVEKTFFRLFGEMKSIIQENNFYKFLAFLIINNIKNVFDLEVENSIHKKEKIIVIGASQQTFATIDYYTYPKYFGVRKAFNLFLKQIFDVVGFESSDILSMEEFFVKNTKPESFLRIIENVYNKENEMSSKESIEKCYFDWEELLEYLQFEFKPTKILIEQPEYLKKSMIFLKDWNKPSFLPFWTYKLLARTSNYHSKLYQLSFEFFGKFLYNIQKKPDYSDMVLSNISLCMNVYLNEQYIHYFTDSNKIQYCRNFVFFAKKVIIQRLKKSRWLSPSTIRQAVHKIQKIKVFVGNKPRVDKQPVIQYSTNMFENSLLFSRTISSDIIQKFKNITSPFIHYIGDMNSYDVNANYSSLDNSIFIPSGILQEPFMDLKKPFVYNLSFLGMIICHELLHSLDDEGCKYDENGLYHNWWNESDKEKYKQIEKSVIKLYEHFTKNTDSVESLKLGENIADIGSMSIVEEILEYYLTENNITGMAQVPYFKHLYLYYASMYKKQNYESFMKQTQLDKHSYSKYRVNCVLANSQKFKECFQISPSDKMYYFDEITQHIW